MPDFFEGKPADISWYPPQTDEHKQKLGEFFNNAAAPPKTLPRIPKIVEELGKSKGIEKWAIIGFCWGGKVCISHKNDTGFSSPDMCLTYDRL
jgi:dienelactone hydrolase